jgi:predicted component of type VI protein secretion system
MKLSLVVMTEGANQGKALEIKLSQFVVGRDPQCHLRPASPMISKRHCAVLQREGKAFVRDFDSTNGTFVNNEQVKGETELHNGDQLKIGPLLFTVLLELSTPVNRPTPPPPTRAATQTARPPQASTPPPATTAKPAAAIPAERATTAPKEPAAAVDKPDGASSNDDDIAAMLLSLHDDGATGAPAAAQEVPEGSTVHELPLPPDIAAQAAQAAKEKAKPSNTANTSAAAKSILEKYMKRPRS